MPGISREIAEKCYALRVRGDSMLPFQKNGDLLIAQRGSHSLIKNGDKAVYHEGQISFVRYVNLNEKAIHLQPLALNFPPNAITKTEFRNLDKIIYIIPA